MIELEPDQLKALAAMRDGCILAGGVGSGKTYTSLQYYLDNHAGKPLVVITTAKKRDSGDWTNEARDLNVPFDLLTVDSWNNIGNYTELKDCFFILDEQRLVGTGAWVKSFYKLIKRNKWILLSGTPGDHWLDYAPVFIANGFYDNITQFRRDHVIYSRYGSFPKVEGFYNTEKLKRLLARVLVPMEIERHTIRHVEMMGVEYNNDVFKRVWKDRWHIYEDRPIKDAGELFRVARRLCGTDPSRSDAVRALSKKHKRLIIFYNFNYELDILRELCAEIQQERLASSQCPTHQPRSTKPSGSGTREERGKSSESGDLESLKAVCTCSDFTFSEWNGHKHQPVPDTLEWIYLVQYTSGAEGWNCVTTNAIAFWSLTYSYKVYEQSMGRIDRRNTPFVDLYYYVLMSKATSCKAVWRALSLKKNFNASTFRNF